MNEEKLNREGLNMSYLIIYSIIGLLATLFLPAAYLIEKICRNHY